MWKTFISSYEINEGDSEDPIFMDYRQEVHFFIDVNGMCVARISNYEDEGDVPEYEVTEYAIPWKFPDVQDVAEIVDPDFEKEDAKVFLGTSDNLEKAKEMIK